MNGMARRLIPLTRLFQSRVNPAPGPGFSSGADRFFLQWLCFAGLLLFAAYLCWRANIWGVLVDADPTGITLMIIAVFVASTLWVGGRAWKLMRERQALEAWEQSLRLSYGPARPPVGQIGAVHDYLSGLVEKGRRNDFDNAQLTEVLAERLHGPSESAWWVNGIQIKLGLLGKVIGFSILALQLGEVQSFDASQSTQLLKNLTGGLGIALLTTVTGLTGNILLGLQLMRLDRFADALIADTLAATHHATGETPHGDRPPGP